MRVPEMPLEPVAIDDRRYDEAPEDEDRIMELLAWVHRRTDDGRCGHRPLRKEGAV